MDKELKFATRFLQASMYQMLSSRNEYEMLFVALSEEDIDKLIGNGVFFARSYSPSSLVELSNVPSCIKMNLILLEANYHKIFLADEIVGILLHEIGHSFNPSLNGIESEFAADEFAKKKGYGKWLILALEKGLKKNLIGFEQEDCIKRIMQLKKI